MEVKPAHLESKQIEIIPRIEQLDLSNSLSDENRCDAQQPEVDSSTVVRLSAILVASGVQDFTFKRVPFDYYDWTLEARRDIIGAASVDHLCKSIVLVNTRAPSEIVDCSDHNNSKFYVVVVQYSARFNAEMVRSFLYALNDGKIAKKKFNLRLAPEEISQNLTGYEHNGVTCVGMKTNIPVILDEAIVRLTPDFFWLGGGEIDLKLGIKTSEFINSVKPFVVRCSGS